MANLILKIQNGEFVESNHLYEKVFTAKNVEANGWFVSITDDGKILCEAKRKYSDGVYSMRYVVNEDGFAKLTVKCGKNKVVTLREGYVSPAKEGIKNGTLALAGGRIDERFAYFRCESFNKLLEEYNLKGIKHQDPNKEYKLEDSYLRHTRVEDDLITDGNIEEVNVIDIFNKRRYEKTGEFKQIKTVVVKDATWAIHKSNGARFLYTLKRKISKLDLPK